MTEDKKKPITMDNLEPLLASCVPATQPQYNTRPGPPSIDNPKILLPIIVFYKNKIQSLEKEVAELKAKLIKAGI